MLTEIKGLHHVTALASAAPANNRFFTQTLGLRRVKTTVNFDAPDVYHLYYGDAAGTPGTIMTYFPFPGMARGRPGTGEVGSTNFAVPKNALGYWSDRLRVLGIVGLEQDEAFGQRRLRFAGPDGDGLALIEVDDDRRSPWSGPVDAGAAIRGFHSVTLRLRDAGATAELLTLMGYEKRDDADGAMRFILPQNNGAGIIDVEIPPNIAPATQGAGSVHHVAFAVENRATQVRVRQALLDAGHHVTPVIDRDYFWAIYFRSPGGVLFEVATSEPGFARDEVPAHLGQALKLPARHEHLRAKLEKSLEPIEI